jgi:polyisoprenoid-binding protein YceI
MQKPTLIAIHLMLALITASQAFGTQQHQFKTDSCDPAQADGSFLRFEMDHSKLGLKPHPFTTCIQEAMLSWETGPDGFRNIQIDIPVSAINTGNDSRNRKMWKKCLAAPEFPTIQVRIPQIPWGTTPLILPAEITIRATTHPIQIEITACSANLVQGQAQMNFKALGIPDPSILVAKLHEILKVNFRMELPNPAP